MNIDTLIALVRKKPPLWDKSSTLYSNRAVLDNCWREIAETMQDDENKIRKKWKYLRDQFSVEFGKIPPAGTADEVAAYEPKWRYYKSLLFLEDVVTPRVSNKNPKKNGQSSDDSDNSSAVDPPSPMEVDKPERKRRRLSRKTLLDLKKQQHRHVLREKHKSKRQAEDSHDEHLHFFKSLLPHVRTIPPHVLLSFRNRVQAVVEEFAYRSAPAVSSSKARFGTMEPCFITCAPDPKYEPFEDSQTPDTKDDASS